MTKIILADTCGIENLYDGGYIDKFNIVFGSAMISEASEEVLAEINFRVPDALNSIDYAVVHMKKEEREFAENIVDIVLTLFGKIDLGIVDASIISIASKRSLDIFTDNRGLIWFFNDFIGREYKKEPYKSSRDKLASDIKYYPQIYTSTNFLVELYGNSISIDVLADYTAKSDFWLNNEDLDTLGINQVDYMDAVYKKKQDYQL
ncbi:MAG: hypothetical protein ACE5J3_03410 [Methanosarcinales archaeon]